MCIKKERKEKKEKKENQLELHFQRKKMEYVGTKYSGGMKDGR